MRTLSWFCQLRFLWQRELHFTLSLLHLHLFDWHFVWPWHLKKPCPPVVLWRWDETDETDGPTDGQTYRVSLKKRTFRRLAPLEAPKLFIGLEIIPKCYQILLLVRCTHLPIFRPFVDGFPQIMDQKMDHLSRTKSIADMYCSVCFRYLYSKIFNMDHTDWLVFYFLF